MYQIPSFLDMEFQHFGFLQINKIIIVGNHRKILIRKL